MLRRGIETGNTEVKKPEGGFDLNRTTTRKGFTLIELLVVIAIIAILAAILFPVFAAAKESGRRGTCMADQKQIITGLLMFAEDHGGKLPCAYFNNEPYAFGAGVSRQWKACVKPFLKSPRVFLCPSDPDIRFKTVWEKSSFSGLEDADSAASYRYNNTLVKRSVRGWPEVPFLVSAAKRPSCLILICESQAYPTPIPKTATPGAVSGWEWNQVAAYKDAPEAVQAQINETMTDPDRCPCAFGRHAGAANYGFCDGHVRYTKWLDTWQPSGGRNGPNLWNGHTAAGS